MNKQVKADEMESTLFIAKTLTTNSLLISRHNRHRPPSFIASHLILIRRLLHFSTRTAKPASNFPWISSSPALHPSRFRCLASFSSSVGGGGGNGETPGYGGGGGDGGKARAVAAGNLVESSFSADVIVLDVRVCALSLLILMY